jgi:hypothetical protein
MITFNNIGYGGRLGNQLFQLAALIGLSYKKNYSASIPVIKNQTVNPTGCLDMYTNKWISYKLDIFNCFNINIEDNNGVTPMNSYKEPFHHFNEKFFDISDDTNIDGYFQSYKYFDHISDIIRQQFIFKEEIENPANILFNKTRFSNPVSIHIRRGDYLGIQHQFPIMDANYYQTAINMFDDDNYQYIVFSDDIQWCKSIFGEDESIAYIENTSHYIDLCIMSMCKHNIIGNSTFGWWGAWLNNNPSKRVIAPKTWFGPALNHLDTSDMIPKEWTKI